MSPMVLRDKLLATILGADTPAPAEPDVSTNPNSSGNWVTVAKFRLPSEVDVWDAGNLLADDDWSTCGPWLI